MDKVSFINEVVDNTRDYVFVRADDSLLIIKPNKVHYLNDTARRLINRMYELPSGKSYQAITEVATEYGISPDQVADDAIRLLEVVLSLLKGDNSYPEKIKTTPFGSHKRELPVLSEIALTYHCQNKCVFCYASSPERGKDTNQMTTEEVKKVLGIIRNTAKVPTVSFTGGEPTLRSDLLELVAFAKSIRLRTNLITNGIICGSTDLPKKLKEAGLDSAQVSLESSISEVHDKVVGNIGAFDKTVLGVKKLQSEGIHTHINTTICKDNINAINLLPKFARDNLGLEYQSMNMVIRTGHACDHPDEIGYKEIAQILPSLNRACHDAGIKLVWYSPMPYCIFNTVACGIGGTTCAACDGLLSIAPDGSVLPCSSFQDGLGNILDKSFEDIWWSKQSLYFRKKAFIPPVCQNCDKASVCLGACPLYWNNRGGFDELGRKGSTLKKFVWKAKNHVIDQVRPIGGVNSGNQH